MRARISRPSFRMPRSGSPESIFADGAESTRHQPARPVVMDSGLALRAPRNDGMSAVKVWIRRLQEGAFREGTFGRDGAECGARARMNAIRSRAALGHRSAGKKTGPHGACLTQGVMRRAGKTPCAPCLEETRFWS